jgi:hypothetical protein
MISKGKRRFEGLDWRLLQNVGVQTLRLHTDSELLHLMAREQVREIHTGRTQGSDKNLMQ